MSSNQLVQWLRRNATSQFLVCLAGARDHLNGLLQGQEGRGSIRQVAGRVTADVHCSSRPRVSLNRWRESLPVRNVLWRRDRVSSITSERGSSRIIAAHSDCGSKTHVSTIYARQTKSETYNHAVSASDVLEFLRALVDMKLHLFDQRPAENDTAAAKRNPTCVFT